MGKMSLLVKLGMDLTVARLKREKKELEKKTGE